MIAHLFKMVWNRKRANSLLILEIFCAFLVLLAALSLGAYSALNYRQPLGFSIADVWLVFAEPPEEGAAENTAVIEQLRLTLKGREEVEAVANIEGCATPYMDSYCGASASYLGKSIEGIAWGRVSDDFREVAGLELIQGRWFEPADEALGWEPAVIDQRLSRALFGTEDPLGKEVGGPDRGDHTEIRVVGVISAYRKRGEWSGPEYFMFRRLKEGERGMFAVKLKPGTPASFEEPLTKVLQSVAGDWSIQLLALSELRGTAFKLRLALLAVAGIVAAFLMFMVGLGLLGVLWQNISRRTREIGLRRALGGTAQAVRRQILGELVLMTTLGVGLGLVVAVQVPLLEVVSSVSVEVYACGVGIALAMIYGLVLLCGLYPSRLATRIQPAEALHYE